MPKFILFDIDHTLIDSAGSGALALNLAFQDVTGIGNGFAGIRFAGKTDLKIISDALEKNRIQIQDGWLGRFLDVYLAHLRTAMSRGAGCVKPGVLDLLDRLVADQDFRLGLLTGNIEEGARIKLEPFGLNAFFQIGAFGSDSEDRNALLPLAVQRLAANTSILIDYRDCVVIGDTPLDVACAKAHEARSIAVATGPYAIEALQETDADLAMQDLSNTDDVVNWLKNL
jgi:phosphoglycolate phosphatase